MLLNFSAAACTYRLDIVASLGTAPLFPGPFRWSAFDSDPENHLHGKIMSYPPSHPA